MFIGALRRLFPLWDEPNPEGLRLEKVNVQQKQRQMDPVARCPSSKAVRKICGPSCWKRKHDSHMQFALRDLFQIRYLCMDETDEWYGRFCYQNFDGMQLNDFVVWISEWPKSSFMAFNDPPAIAKCEAKVCLRLSPALMTSLIQSSEKH